MLAVTVMAIAPVLPAVWRSRARSILIALGLWIAGVLYVRGDWMGAFRFLVPSLPYFALLAAIVQTAGVERSLLSAVALILLVAGLDAAGGSRPSSSA